MKNKVYNAKCVDCGKVVASLSKSQFQYNFDLHTKACLQRKLAKTKVELNPSKEGDAYNSQEAED